MNPLKLRKLLISIHLYCAAVLTPAFLLVAVTGGLYLSGVSGETKNTPLELPAGFTLDTTSPSAVEDVRALAKDLGLNIRIEYLRGRGGNAQTRPTTGTHIQFTTSPEGTAAVLKEPNLQYALMELHKGHGPRIFRTYSAIAGLALFIVVVGGFLVGVLAPAYRKPTLIGTGVGTILFFLMGWVL